MKKLLQLFFSVTIGVVALGFLFLSPVMAIEDPTKTPNNKIGIHILFPEELPEAAKLINSNGGEWGYVIIPIQAGDKDILKWQKFMDESKKLRVIPIIRLATEGDWFNTHVWRKPTYTDIVDFANFLNSLTWPTKNRYIVAFNEVNRGDEWGGSPQPAEYADILIYTVSVFKTYHEDFFIISAGMDNAAPNKPGEYMDQYTYMRLMNQKIPGIFNKVDGLSSHSYPNPAFIQPPTRHTNMSITSFQYEKALAKELGGKDLPIFITETGWDIHAVTPARAASYYKEAFSSIWNDPSVVAVTPFLLNAGGGPFEKFSFLKTDGSPAEHYKAIIDMPKTKGNPTLTKTVLGKKTQTVSTDAPVIDFNEQEKGNHIVNPPPAVTMLVKMLFGL